MRFHFSDAARARRLARLLQTELSRRHGIDRPLSACRSVLAEACGYPNFHELEASSGKAVASVVDEGAPVETVIARHGLQRAALLGAGLAPAVADDLLGRIGFTAARKPSDLGASSRGQVEARATTDSPERHGMMSGDVCGATLFNREGDFLGIAFGTSWRTVNEEAPKALFETLGIPLHYGMDTVAHIRMTGADPSTIALFDANRSWGTALHLGVREGRASSHRRGAFSVSNPERPWDSGVRDPDAGPITAWGFEGAVVLGFAEPDRERIRALADAARSNALAMTFSGTNGLIALLADRLDPAMLVEDLVRHVENSWALDKPVPASDTSIFDLRLSFPRIGPAPTPGTGIGEERNPWSLTPRQERIQAHGGSGMRGGNFGSQSLHASDGTLVGIGLGTDGAYEHDNLPEELLEALGVREGATTVGEGVAHRVTSTHLYTDARGLGETVASVLHLNPGDRETGVVIERDRFDGGYRSNAWRLNDRKAPFGILNGWSYRAVTVCGFEDDAKDAIHEIAEAAARGDLSLTFSRRTGLTLLIADRIDHGLDLDDLVNTAWTSRRRTRMDGGCERTVLDLATPLPRP